MQALLWPYFYKKRGPSGGVYDYMCSTGIYCDSHLIIPIKASGFAHCHHIASYSIILHQNYCQVNMDLTLESSVVMSLNERSGPDQYSWPSMSLDMFLFCCLRYPSLNSWLFQHSRPTCTMAYMYLFKYSVRK